MGKPAQGQWSAEEKVQVERGGWSRTGLPSNDVLPIMTRPPRTKEQSTRGASLGRQVARSRQAAELTQSELAVRAGVSLQALLKLEQGHVADPGVFSISALAAALDRPIEYLVAAAERAERGGHLSTLGYQGLDIDAFLGRLAEMQVEVVADVRLNPLSRKPGFSKTKLREALEAHGIQYVHYRALGNPKSNRSAFVDGNVARGRSRYRALLHGETAQAALRDIHQTADKQHVALLCFEQLEATCHRAVIAEELDQLG